MDAVILAGGIPQPSDPLYEYSQGESKALIDVAGKPMVQWVVDALSNAKKVDNIIIIGLSPKSSLKSKKPLHYISNQGRMLSNIVMGVAKSIELNKKTQYVMVVSSDIPGLKPEMVDWLVKKASETKDDLYYGVCPREVMEARYPNSNRTYTKLKDMQVCGADINITHVSMTTDHLDTWEKLIGNRKSPLRQASVIGLDTLWRLWRKQFTLQELVERASERINIKGRAIIWDHAEPCMDVDKPHQLELMRDDLSKQAKKPASKAKKVSPKKAVKAKGVAPKKKTVKAKTTKAAGKPATTKKKAGAKSKKK